MLCFDDVAFCFFLEQNLSRKSIVEIISNPFEIIEKTD